LSSYNSWQAHLNISPGGADLTGDCHVNIFDLKEFANGWLTSYDFADFASFGSEWGT
jgi:hypothetical protein